MNNSVSAPKTDMFCIRVNPETHSALEQVCANNGLTLTNAVSVFIQQSLNAEGFVFPVTWDNVSVIRKKAMPQLVKEVQKGDECPVSYSEDEARKLLGLAP